VLVKEVRPDDIGQAGPILLRAVRRERFKLVFVIGIGRHGNIVVAVTDLSFAVFQELVNQLADGNWSVGRPDFPKPGVPAAEEPKGLVLDLRGDLLQTLWRVGVRQFADEPGHGRGFGLCFPLTCAPEVVLFSSPADGPPEPDCPNPLFCAVMWTCHRHSPV